MIQITTKHIEVDQNFIKEKLEESLISMSYVLTGEQLADFLMKGLKGGNLIILLRLAKKVGFDLNPS